MTDDVSYYHSCYYRAVLGWCRVHQRISYMTLYVTYSYWRLRMRPAANCRAPRLRISLDLLDGTRELKSVERVREVALVGGDVGNHEQLGVAVERGAEDAREGGLLVQPWLVGFRRCLQCALIGYAAGERRRTHVDGQL